MTARNIFFEPTLSQYIYIHKTREKKRASRQADVLELLFTNQDATGNSQECVVPVIIEHSG